MFAQLISEMGFPVAALPAIAAASIAFVGVLLAQCVVIFTAILSPWWNFRQQKKLKDYEERHSTFSKLMGLQYTIPQAYQSKLDARVMMFTCERYWKALQEMERDASIEKLERSSDDLAGRISESRFEHSRSTRLAIEQEVKRFGLKDEEMTIKLAESNRDLYECIGRILILFRREKRIEQLAWSIYQTGRLDVQRPPSTLQDDEIMNWQLRVSQELERRVKERYGDPIEHLIIALKESPLLKDEKRWVTCLSKIRLHGCRTKAKEGNEASDGQSGSSAG